MADLTTAEIASRYGVSVRTARRHKASGTLPDERRAVGRDGKSYAATPEAYAGRRVSRTPLRADLDVARNALRRLARSPTFAGADLQQLGGIVTEALMLKGKWAEGRAMRVEPER